MARGLLFFEMPNRVCSACDVSYTRPSTLPDHPRDQQCTDDERTEGCQQGPLQAVQGPLQMSASYRCESFQRPISSRPGCHSLLSAISGANSMYSAILCRAISAFSAVTVAS